MLKFDIKMNVKYIISYIYLFFLFGDGSMQFVSGSDQSILDQYSLNKKTYTQFSLPKELKEISGLAMSSDGKLFCHNDEKGIIYQLDFKNGTIVNKFKLGWLTVQRDFEGIAIAENMFYLVTSSGVLYRFKEDGDKKTVPYDVYDTGLSAKNNIEGLCYDPETNSLLLACKGEAGKGYINSEAIYSFSLLDMELLEKPRFLIPIKKIKKESKEDDFAPSGIARHPSNGNFFVIASSGNMILEISKTGEILNQKRLNKKWHEQPEGITFSNDFDLLISDEGRSGKGQLTIYPFQKSNKED